MLFEGFRGESEGCRRPDLLNDRTMATLSAAQGRSGIVGTRPEVLLVRKTLLRGVLGPGRDACPFDGTPERPGIMLHLR